jgi:metal-responsive CopG/Arc/MetJ family transcriptional regulator
MKTVQITLDEELVATVDRVARRLGTSRSAFAREALRDALRRIRVRSLEQKQRDGYARKPVRRSEFNAWEREQTWVEPAPSSRR